MTEWVAIHVPNKWLSKAVQEYLFSKGYGWTKGGKIVWTDPVDKYGKEARIYVEDDKTLEFGGGMKHKSYIPLTVDEFFKREEEKEVWPKRLSLGVAYRSTNVTAWVDKIHLIDAEDEDIIIAITWPELEQILALRPKETP